MSDEKPTRRVPEGVDARSWIGFEDRIGQRRFAALAATIGAAAATGDLVSARAAIEEARLLRPDTPELSQLEMKVLAIEPLPDAPRFWPRVASGAALVVVGVSMVIGLESMRRGGTPTGPPEAALTRSPVHSAVGVAPDAPDAPGAPIAQGEPGASSAGDVSAEPAPTRRVEPAQVERALGQTRVASSAVAARVPRPLEEPSLEEPSTVAPSRVGRSRVEPSPVAPPVESSRAQNASVAARTVTGSASASTPEPSAPEPLVTPPAPARPAAERRPAAQPAPRMAELSAPPPMPGYTPAPAVSPPVGTINEDESRVADVLRRYARAYGALDASAAREVWPSVNQRALARAFESLESQELSLQDCQIDVRGATANASCRGQAQYVGKVGSGEPRVEPRMWRFELRRDGDAWKIANAEARRPTS